MWLTTLLVLLAVNVLMGLAYRFTGFRPLGCGAAFPMTLAGVLVRVFGWSTAAVTWDEAFVFLPKGHGLLFKFFDAFKNVGAFTWGNLVFARDEVNATSVRIERHESEHARQTMRWGVLFPFAYLAASLWALVRGKHWYRDNTFERRARAMELVIQ